METREMKVTVLTASEGRWLTQSADVPTENRVYVRTAYVGRADTPDNWREASDEERTQFEAARQPKSDEPETDKEE